MENDENKSIFTFDPGEPPEGFIPDEENAEENVVFDWDPSYDADIYPEMSDLNSVSEEGEGTESDAGPSFLERCRDFFRSVKLPSVKVQLPAMKSIFKNKYVISAPSNKPTIAIITVLMIKIYINKKRTIHVKDYSSTYRMCVKNHSKSN